MLTCWASSQTEEDKTETNLEVSLLIFITTPSPTLMEKTALLSRVVPRYIQDFSFAWIINFSRCPQLLLPFSTLLSQWVSTLKFLLLLHFPNNLDATRRGILTTCTPSLHQLGRCGIYETLFQMLQIGKQTKQAQSLFTGLTSQEEQKHSNKKYKLQCVRWHQSGGSQLDSWGDRACVGCDLR